MKNTITILVLALLCNRASSQHGISFQHLNTSNGLSYLGVNDMCADKKGNLWIATGNGLNMFNGRSVNTYFASEFPQMKSSNVIHVTCDSSNRVWILTAGGNVTMLDEKRQMHRISLYRNDSLAKTAWILNSQHGGIILWTNKGHYIFKPETVPANYDSLGNDRFISISIKGFDTLGPKGYSQVFYYDDDHYLFVNQYAIFKVNYFTKQVEKKYALPDITALIKWGTGSLLAFDRTARELIFIDLVTGTSTPAFKNARDQYGKKIDADFLYAQKINATQYLFTTFASGIYVYDTKNGGMFHHTHNIADPASISDNATTTIATGKKGWVFITCNPNGISYFNNDDLVSNQNIFSDKKGNNYDGYISGIATKDNNTYYIGTSEGLLQWKRNTNNTTFINYPGAGGKPLFRKEEIHSILIDDQDRIWSTTISQGIIVIDKNLALIKHIWNNDRSRNGIKLSRVTYLTRGPDGFIWACGESGICRIDPRTFEVDNFENTTLAELDSKYCAPVIFTDSNNLWSGTNNEGVVHYNLQTGNLQTFTVKNGLTDNGIFCINADREKNIYIGTRTGLNILFPDGRIKVITQKDGLLIDRAEGLLLDKHDRMWIGNDIGLACYNTKDSSLTTFDERFGLSIYGFRVGSYFQTPNGEFVLGTPRGLQYFHPDSLFNSKISLNALISKIETKNISSSITMSETFNLSSSDNQVTFYFSSVDFTPHLRTYYQYKLEGADKEWLNIADQNAVRYNTLPAGTYVFKVRISNDKKHWQDAENEVTIIIATPIYKTWWFRLLSIILCLMIIGYVINHYRKQQEEKRSSLETELVITYFASQINSHTNTDQLLWDVAKNCISKLHFEDCVIYLKNEAGNMLIQKAAYGPKNPVDFTIHKPIQVPVGEGITGTVAQTGKAEVVNNTGADNRYIVDDERRCSEIAVPIMINNKVIGVIDSEHSQKNFFTPKHLSILQTIAVLCANQVQKTKAEEDKQKANIELWENKQRAAESRLQSLRLQMNPHFLFNALNSIQQMILANEEMVATRYLSRFSKLLRTVLIHSDKEKVSLKDEIDILKMYVELESVRFKDSFSYSITCDELIETEEITIPTLLIQPFVENAIWHGLMHKEGDRQLHISFTEQGDLLQCIIEDNGIGRKKAREITSLDTQDKNHTGKGIAVSEERLRTLKNSSGTKGSILINDITGPGGEVRGTRVIINFPIQN